MEIKQCFLTKNNCYQTGRTIRPTGIVVHSTGANNPNLKRYVQPDDGFLGKNTNNNDWNRGGIEVCVHAFIGKDAGGKVCCYQTLPWNYRPWGCGSGKRGSYNNSHIQFEICEDDLHDYKYYQEAMGMAKKLCAYLCQTHGIGIEHIVSHHEAFLQGCASNHSDCDHWLRQYGDNMDKFRADVKKIMNNQAGDTKEEEDMPKIEKLTVIVDGKEHQLDGIFSSGSNYVSVRQLAQLLGCNVTTKGNIPVIEKK